MEGGGVANLVVGGQHQQQRVGILNRKGGERAGGGGVATGRFQDDAARRATRLAKLFGGEEAVLLVADDQRRGEAQAIDGGSNPQGGVLQQAAVGAQRQELFWVEFARQRPQARSRSAGQQHRNDGLHGIAGHRVALWWRCKAGRADALGLRRYRPAFQPATSATGRTIRAIASG
jgi:hypothetical protein